MIESIIHHRRSVRIYDPEQELNTESVKKCLELATLAPNSSNMQLWEFYHITDPKILKKLAAYCMGQSAATTAKEMVVFITRQDLYRDHARKVLALEKDNILRNSPASRQKKRIKDRKLYYGMLMPFLYSRASGFNGLIRKMIVGITGIFRPVVREVSEADMRVVVHKSCALAAQTFMLAMADKGYDTCPMEGFDSTRVKNELRLPSGAEINMIISCGIRSEEGIWGDRTRLPFEEIYHHR